MTRYFVLSLVVALCLACAGVSGKQEQQQQDLVTGAAIVKSQVPSKLTRAPKTVPWGMTPKEEKEAMREIAEEEEAIRQRYDDESKKTGEAVKKLKFELDRAKEKLATAKADHEKAKSGPCPSSTTKDAAAQTFRAEEGAETKTACVEAKAKADAEAAVEEAERMLRNAMAMDDAAKMAVNNSKFIPVDRMPLGDGRSHIGRASAGMGRRDKDGAHWPTVVVNAAFLLLIAEALTR